MAILIGYNSDRNIVISVDATSLYESLLVNNLLNNYDAIDGRDNSLENLPIIDWYSPAYFDKNDIDHIINDTEKLAIKTPKYSDKIIGIRGIILHIELKYIYLSLGHLTKTCTERVIG